MTFNACTDACGGWATRSAAVKKMIDFRAPDVLAVQEANSWQSPPEGYGLAVSKSAKALFYKTSRLSVARTGNILMRAPNKYAVWAELVDRATSKRMIVVSAHTSPAFADYPERGKEISTLLSRVNYLNSADLPVMYAGDFNSHKNRGTYSDSAGFGAQDTVGRTFAAAGYYDSSDLARRLARNNWNSYGGWNTTPTKSVVWGDHVDHVYIKPGRHNVYQWMNAALNTGTRYTGPLPSDHRPVMVHLYVD
jgi:endonuclease/exonuclease/phosphatase family metal-dependent hydrolase